MDRRAQLAGLVWAEELFESVRRSEVLSCPQVWPGSLAHARGLASSLPGARAAGVDVDRLTDIVQRSAAALWDVLLTWSKLDRRANLEPGEESAQSDQQAPPDDDGDPARRS